MLLLSQPGHWTRPPCGHFDLNIQRRINGSGEMILGLVLTPRVAQLAGGLEWPLIWDKLLALKHKRARHADYVVFVSSLPDVWCHMIHDILSCVRPGTQASLSFSTSSFLTYCHDGALQAWRLCNRLSSLLHFTTSHQLGREIQIIRVNPQSAPVTKFGTNWEAPQHHVTRHTAQTTHQLSPVYLPV